MDSEDTTTSESHHKDKDELPTLPSETSDDISTESTREKKVVVVKPTETDLKDSDVPGSGSSEEVKKQDDNDIE
ncbi:MAG: hypothetical protein ACJ71K_12515 [Nitrososphaeraceae archaeon]